MRVSAIFKSISGEVNAFHQGSITTFVRLAGCNLRCVWCDTKYAQLGNSGTIMTVDQIFKRIAARRTGNVTITGGEPLLQQKELKQLVLKLYERGYNISIETNGSIKIPIWNEVAWVADWKCPSSHMSDKMLHSNFTNLAGADIVKFVVACKNDFDHAVEVIQYQKKECCDVTYAFSPCNALNAAKLIDWMKATKETQGAIFSLQIHKLIWPLAQEQGIEV